MRTPLLTVVLASFAGAAGVAGAGCGSSDFGPHAPEAEVALQQAPTADSPYEVELISGSQTLPTYAHNGRFYVMGQVGQRYGIRVKNPTNRRVEAVISVDGLDVIDGETAHGNKRGYVVMPGASITVDGFRVSTSHVAAFRFSSVDNSYAGRKGKARNVGVIGVAIFEEKASQPMILPQDRVSSREDFGNEGELDDDADYGPGARGADKKAKDSVRSRNIRGTSRRRPAPSITGTGGAPSQDVDVYQPPAKEECCSPRTNRPGLGTEYGERRYSAVGFTRFVRESSTKPSAYAELRYNNAAGLAALGINSGEGFDPNEVTRRETAEPFPGQRFSQPPQ